MENQQSQDFGVGFIDFSQYQEDLGGKDPKKEEEVTFEEQVQDPVEEKEEEEETPTESSKRKITEEPEKEGEEDKVIEPELTAYSSIARKYIENGIWDDYLVEVDGKEVPISEVENLDEDTFLEIQKAQKSETDKNYIRRDELDEVAQDLFDIIKQGGDVTQLLQMKKDLIDPLNSYDLNNELHQETLVRHMYAVENGITDPKKIDALIKAHKENLDLDSTASGFAERLHNYYKAAADKQKEDLQKKVEERKKIDNELRKSLEGSLKKYVKNTNAIKPLIDAATKVEKDLGTYRVNTDFIALRNNPDEFAEYLLWRYNKEEYNKIITQEEQKETVRKNLTRLNLVRQDKTPTAKSFAKKSKTDEFMSQLVDI